MAESNAPTPATKLGGYDFYRQVLRSPKFIVAPMVDQSELAWRTLSRRYGSQLVYTPMINAKMFADGHRKPYREQNFNLKQGEEGGEGDRPLFVQFCGNNPDQLLQSALVVQDHCDAVDINFGCPQEIARKGRYGCYLQEDKELVFKLVNTLHVNLNVPVTAKFRVFDTVEETVEYAKMLERAGAQILTCHGRTRDQRGTKSGLADWEKIRAVKKAVSVPVFANGNILYHSDIARCLEATGADGVMSAEGQLYNPALFATSSSSPSELAFDEGSHPRHADLALEYLEIVKAQKTPTPFSGVKGHLFKIMRPALGREPDLRDRLQKVKVPKGDKYAIVEAYVGVVREMKERMDRDAKAAEGKTVEELTVIDPTTGLKILPHWLSQPYFRPGPIEAALPEKSKMAQKLQDKKAQETVDLGKRAHSARTPEPEAKDEAESKKAKLDEERPVPVLEGLIAAVVAV